MSQGDYIQRKRIANQVASKNRNPLNRQDNPSVFSSQIFTQINQYDLVNIVVNSCPTYNQLIPNTDLRFMEMNLRQPSISCDTYRNCGVTNTNALPNTVLTKTFFNFSKNLPYVNNHIPTIYP